MKEQREKEGGHLPTKPGVPAESRCSAAVSGRRHFQAQFEPRGVNVGRTRGVSVGFIDLLCGKL